MKWYWQFSKKIIWKKYGYILKLIRLFLSRNDYRSISKIKFLEFSSDFSFKNDASWVLKLMRKCLDEEIHILICHNYWYILTQNFRGRLRNLVRRNLSNRKPCNFFLSNIEHRFHSSDYFVWFTKRYKQFYKKLYNCGYNKCILNFIEMSTNRTRNVW